VFGFGFGFGIGLELEFRSGQLLTVGVWFLAANNSTILRLARARPPVFPCFGPCPDPAPISGLGPGPFPAPSPGVLGAFGPLFVAKFVAR